MRGRADLRNRRGTGANFASIRKTRRAVQRERHAPGAGRNRTESARGRRKLGATGADAAARDRAGGGGGMRVGRMRRGGGKQPLP